MRKYEAPTIAIITFDHAFTDSIAASGFEDTPDEEI